MPSQTHSQAIPLEPIDAYRWRIPKSYDARMRVDGIIYASAELLPAIRQDQSLQQVANVAQLPGIVGASLAMPDIHWGYGFAIGGVAAFDATDGVISPGGVGYDINCGVRLLRSDLKRGEVAPKLEALLTALYRGVPAGVGSEGRIRVKGRDLDRVLEQGAAWAVSQGYGWKEDLERTEDGGRLPDADPAGVSERARERGGPQLGTLGSGNHFLEVQAVDEVYDARTAERFGLEKGSVTIMIHCGSRGLGYQVCDDYLDVFRGATRKYGIELPDGQLACGPLSSPEARAYLAAMAAAANYAWANRQAIAHWVREACEQVFGTSAERLGLHQVYDVCHNIAKLETHQVSGAPQQVCVHRKGATRSFPAGHPAVSACYRDVGQPVLIPGSMGTASYVCVGTPRAMEQSFGSTAHGAGRLLSRHEALRRTRGRHLIQELGDRGIRVQVREKKTLGEEAPEAYKDIDRVVAVVDAAGLSAKVARLVPLAVVKG
jgi:tRNA-splicing ligase RtcB (3'-phosphate/5'-hydroxy nucleic acid ligase)